MTNYYVMGIKSDGTEVCLEHNDSQEVCEGWIDDHINEVPDLVLYIEPAPTYLN